MAYRSLADKNGVYRWRKVAAKGRPPATAAKGKPAAATSQPGAGKGPEGAEAERHRAAAKLQRAIAKNKLGPLERAIKAAALPCVSASYRKAGALVLGASRLGGLPDVPAGFLWPRGTDDKKARKCRKTPLKTHALSFIAQLDCADLAPYGAELGLPPDGLLSFFYETGNSTMMSPASVVYIPAGRRL